MANFRENIAAASRELAKKATGASFWLKSTVTSKTLSTTEMNLTNLSEGGELEIEDIIIRGHGGILGGAGGGLSGGRTFRIFSPNAYGSSVVLAVGVGEVGTSRVMTLGMLRLVAASLTASSGFLGDFDPGNQVTILEEGKRLTVANESSGSTGDGSVTVHVKFRRLADDADVTVA